MVGIEKIHGEEESKKLASNNLSEIQQTCMLKNEQNLQKYMQIKNPFLQKNKIRDIKLKIGKNKKSMTYPDGVDPQNPC